MATLPSNPRIQAIHDVGVKIDDALERAQLDTARREGAHEAYTNIVSSFSTLMSDIDAESAHGNDSEPAKLWMNKLLVICKNMADYSGTQLHAARGAEAQTRMIIETVKRMYDTEISIIARSRSEQPEHSAISLGEPSPEGILQADAPEVELPAPAPEEAISKRPIPAATLKEQRRNALVSIKP
jgi:hypothetical protein